ncbi:hypothetical protein SRHO_G00201610 [Serrasalmus rhombeus]
MDCVVCDFSVFKRRLGVLDPPASGAFTRVDKHKTDRAYGNACLALNHHKVSWLRRLVDVSVQFGGGRCDYLFQYNGNQLTKICEELRAAWRDAQMPGCISFGLIRASISNQAKRHLSAEDRKLVCEAMCHGVGTADRFYTALPGVSEMFRLRDLRMRALEQDGIEPETDDTDSGELQTSTSDTD